LCGASRIQLPDALLYIREGRRGGGVEIVYPGTLVESIMKPGANSRMIDIGPFKMFFQEGLERLEKKRDFNNHEIPPERSPGEYLYPEVDHV
jgi:hypothetical protein